VVVDNETSIMEGEETLIIKVADEDGSITMVDVVAVIGVQEEVEEISGAEEVDTTGGEVDTNVNN